MEGKKRFWKQSGNLQAGSVKPTGVGHGTETSEAAWDEGGRGQVLWGTEQRTDGKEVATTQELACADASEVTSIARSSVISRESGDLIFVWNNIATDFSK